MDTRNTQIIGALTEQKCFMKCIEAGYIVSKPLFERDGIFYLYPAPEEGLKEKTLRVLPPKSGQIKNISFAKDFIFEEIIKNY